MHSSLLVLTVLLFAVASEAYSPTYTGSTWQAFASAVKSNTLNSRVLENNKNNGWVSKLHLAELLVESMNRTFDYAGDDMPGQNLFNLEERPKLLFPVGAIAEANWVDLGNHSYTGVFAGGCESIFIRMGLALPPSMDDGKLITPGIAIKALRSGQKSANVMAMASLLGQPSFNFFEHDMTNHAPMVNPNSPMVTTNQRFVYKAFLEASEWPVMVGVSDMATYTCGGQKAENVTFPYRLVFHATNATHNRFPSNPNPDDNYFLTQLSMLTPGTLYYVYVQPTPDADVSPAPIGRIDLTSVPTSSKFGDKDMFFQHQRMEDDMALRPEWVPAAARIVQEQAAHTPYMYPDLPFNI
eukprot:PhM_4_TR11681/c2_g3_i1/m.76169